MGLFFYNQKGSIISIEDLPTTEIIEPVFKVPEAKGISLNDLDEIVRCFQFCVWIRQFEGVDNLVFIFQKSSKNCLKDRVYAGTRLFNEVKEMVRVLLLEMEK